MRTKVTARGQVILPKSVREAVGIVSGDEVDVRVTSAGAILVEKVRRCDAYAARLRALARRRLIRGTTTEALMATSRGEG